jgi:ectoine hydroxylase-related dioxygenase (phytanoyl-CoA dioxygenase family)
MLQPEHVDPKIGPLTQSQVEQYFREGYLVVPKLLPPDAVDRVVNDLNKLVPVNAAQKTWQPSVWEHANPTKNAPLHRLLVEPQVIRAVEQIFELPARVLYGMTAVVPAGGGKGLPWHQDNQYDLVLGFALNVFMAMCDITPDKAILWVAPKSHLKGVQPSQLASIRDADIGGHRDAVVEPDDGMPLPTLHKGDAVIFDRSTYHRSLKNLTTEDRYAYAAQYQADNARDAKTGKKDGFRTLPLAWDLREEMKPLLER